MTLANKLWAGAVIASFGAGAIVARTLTKPVPPTVEYRERVVTKTVVQKVYVSRKNTVKTTTDTKPDGEKIVTQEQTVVDSRANTAVNVNQQANTSYRSDAVRVSNWGAGLSLSLSPSTELLSRQFSARVSRRLVGPVWADLTLQTQPHNLSHTSILGGLSVEF